MLHKNQTTFSYSLFALCVAIFLQLRFAQESSACGVPYVKIDGTNYSLPNTLPTQNTSICDYMSLGTVIPMPIRIETCIFPYEFNASYIFSSGGNPDCNGTIYASSLHGSSLQPIVDGNFNAMNPTWTNLGSIYSESFLGPTTLTLAFVQGGGESYPCNTNVYYFEIEILGYSYAFDVPDRAICQSGTVYQHGSNITPFSGPSTLSCEWTPTTGLDHPSSCTNDVSPTATQTYSIHHTNSDGCSYTDQTTIHVINPAMINLGDDQTKCPNEPYPTLSLPISQGALNTNDLNISWKRNGVGINPSNSANFTPTSIGEYCVEISFPNSPECGPIMDCIVINEHMHCDTCNIASAIELNSLGCQLEYNFIGAAGSLTQIIGYYWRFGDGSFAFGDSGTHNYLSNGTYNVELTVYGRTPSGECCQHTISEVFQHLCVRTGCHVESNFAARRSNRRTRVFSNTSSTLGNTNIIGYHWDFGDGTTSISPNPTHSYATGGIYNVCLTTYGVSLTGECCSDTKCRNVKAKKCWFLDIFKPKYKHSDSLNGKVVKQSP